MKPNTKPMSDDKVICTICRLQLDYQEVIQNVEFAVFWDMKNQENMARLKVNHRKKKSWNFCWFLNGDQSWKRWTFTCEIRTSRTTLRLTSLHTGCWSMLLTRLRPSSATHLPFHPHQRLMPFVRFSISLQKQLPTTRRTFVPCNASLSRENFPLLVWVRWKAGKCEFFLRAHQRKVQG